MEKKKIFIKEFRDKRNKYIGRYLNIDGKDFPVYEVKIVDGLINSCYCGAINNNKVLNEYITISLKLPLDFYEIHI